ncbi:MULTISPECIES: PDC sensor domain-containing protein [Thiorhodovibrio]|uniref:PDC sensor domain-containing protein n=1 Tax=Thiorhodovibrio TaxID=61593 RepID=UPI001913D147|nr:MULTISPECIES: PDC sensor domain-containing protein [Thiorhodovibrio]MBK5968056.1 hypothetical protein [Thiorhodovibrio winogradskyi]WPL11873.1 hypothetical protein Thiosp_01625 [Thiorhodovibrio litoralis]
MSDDLQAAIASQRLALHQQLSEVLARLEAPFCERWGDRDALEQLLSTSLDELRYCKYLYLLDAGARQITANASREGLLPDEYGRDRSERPYMREVLAGATFSLSPAYLSRNKRRPSLTAVRRLHAANDELLGFLGADFDLRDLPLTRVLHREPDAWRQLKGDPAIRGALFYQQRADSLMDGCIAEVLDLMAELILAHGVFHGKLHFSSSRATIWLFDDPFRYRVLDFDALSNPSTCLAYPRRDYAAEAVIPPEAVPAIFARLRELRFMDENIYLRSGSLNIMNGMVALNFSCDGSHYMRWDEFIDKRMTFWLGAGGEPECPPGAGTDAS